MLFFAQRKTKLKSNGGDVLGCRQINNMYHALLPPALGLFSFIDVLERSVMLCVSSNIFYVIMAAHHQDDAQKVCTLPFFRAT